MTIQTKSTFAATICSSVRLARDFAGQPGRAGKHELDRLATKPDPVAHRRELDGARGTMTYATRKPDVPEPVRGDDAQPTAAVGDDARGR